MINITYLDMYTVKSIMYGGDSDVTVFATQNCLWLIVCLCKSVTS